MNLHLMLQLAQHIAIEPILLAHLQPMQVLTRSFILLLFTTPDLLRHRVNPFEDPRCGTALNALSLCYSCPEQRLL